MKRTNIYLSEVQWKKLTEVAKKLGLKVSEVIRRLVDEGLKQYEKRR
jgi:macrodomain Ter protein organizer (MatP/YcbG family)